MGAWGYRNFENDDALDFSSAMFEDNINSGEIYTVINAVADIVNKEDPEYGPDAYDSSRALAGIEYIAAAKGNPSSDIPDEVKKWLLRNDPLVIKIGGVFGIGGQKIEIEALSKQAIKQIKENSELKELWEESEDYENWLEVLTDLEKRIS